MTDTETKDSEKESNTLDFSIKLEQQLEKQKEEQYYTSSSNGAKKFHHDVFGDYLIDQYNIINLDDRLHIYQDGIYEDKERLIKRAMVKEIKSIKRREQSEVLEYLRSSAPLKEREHPDLIAVKNGVYNIKTDEFINYSPKHVFTSKINADYNPDAYSEVVNDTLITIANEDVQVMNLFTEIIGYLLYRRNFLGKSFLLVGPGGNGKSTFINMLSAFVGQENVSSVPLQDLSERFSKASLYQKFLNAGDDIPLKSVKDASDFKKFTTGERNNAEFKGENSFEFRNYAKLIFSANDLPRWLENSDGIFDRLVIVPLTARLRGTKKQDVFLEEKITTEEARSYLLNIGIKALKQLINKRYMSVPDTAESIMTEFKKDNDPLLNFIEFMNEEGQRGIVERKTFEVFEDYLAWCESEGHRFNLTQRKFTTTIKKYGYDTERITGGEYKGKYIFVPNIN